VRFYIDGRETHHVISLKGCDKSCPPASMETPTDYSEEETKEEAARVASEEPTLSDIADNYNFLEELEKKLEYLSIGSIKDLILRFPLSYKERCSIMSNVLPSRAFFANLFRKRPTKQLSDLQGHLEKRRMPNKMVFKNINEVSLTSSCTLGELEKYCGMQYVLDNIADNLIPEDGTLLPTWKNIASASGYSLQEINLFCKVHQNTEFKAKRLLTLLCSKSENLPAFIQKLNDIGRNDIAQLVEDWRNTRMGRKRSPVDGGSTDEEQTISVLADYNLIQHLGRHLDASSPGGIKDFCTQFHFPKELVRNITTSVLPCKAFFTNLSVGQPDKALEKLREIIEKKLDLPNKSIFLKIDEDIQKNLLSFSLNAQLGVLVDDAEKWLYILTNIAYELLPEDPTLLPSWQNVASLCDYNPEDIKLFEVQNKIDEDPTQKLMAFLLACKPSYPISNFIENLKKIGRMDIVNSVKDHLQKKRESSSITSHSDAAGTPPSSIDVGLSDENMLEGMSVGQLLHCSIIIAYNADYKPPKNRPTCN